MKKNIFLLFMLSVLVYSCTPKAVDEDSWYTPDTNEDIVKLMQEMNEENGVHASNYTLLTLDEFVAKYMTDYGVFFPVRQRSYTYSGGGYNVDPSDYTKNNRGWFSIDTIPMYRDGGIYICGYVTTEDYDGTFYKSMVIQQMVEGEQQALRLSVDAGNLGATYELGQKILIRVNGLGIGKYANEPQLCVPSYNDNVHSYHADQKMGWAPGRIPAGRFTKAVRLIGRPSKNNLHYDELTIADIINTPADDEHFHKMDGRLVRIKNVHFPQSNPQVPGSYIDQNNNRKACTTNNPDQDVNSCVFAPFTENQGYPQGRVIEDESSAWSLVSTSEYAKFAHLMLPYEEYIGTIEGILGHYTDNGRNDPDQGDWSITLRSRYDLIDFKAADGTVWCPEYDCWWEGEK